MTTAPKPPITLVPIPDPIPGYKYVKYKDYGYRICSHCNKPFRKRDYLFGEHCLVGGANLPEDKKITKEEYERLMQLELFW